MFVLPTRAYSLIWDRGAANFGEMVGYEVYLLCRSVYNLGLHESETIFL